MKNITISHFLICLMAAIGAPQAPAKTCQEVENCPSLGIMRPRHFYREGSQSKTNPLMTYHGSKILPIVVSKAIFWGPHWAHSNFAGDKISGLDAWYLGHNGSHYAATVSEYYDTLDGGHTVNGSGFIHQGHIIDTSLAANGQNPSAILNEVCKQVLAGKIVPDPAGNGFYAVYSDLKRNGANYCAYHSFGTCPGSNVVVQFAFFFDLEGDYGCDPRDTHTGHSQALAALANATAHELSEARSNPTLTSWYDEIGAENGDKCAWTYHVPYVVFPDHKKWKLQGEWSNAAYLAGTGYPNSQGLRGCLDGY